MELLLQRYQCKSATTLGRLLVGGKFECLTLEDEIRVDDPSTPDVDEDVKVYGKTAIPAGRYRVDNTWSYKFQKMMLAILDVPGFTGIRIHSGNDADDTLGCVLVGDVKDSDTRIHGGSVALPRLAHKVLDAIARKEEVWITVQDPGVI